MRKILLGFLAALALPFPAEAGPEQMSYPPGHAQDTSWFPTRDGRFSLVEEDDCWASHDDRHYTHGIRFSYLTPALSPQSPWEGAFNGLAQLTPMFDGKEASRHANLMLGHSMFTPENIRRANPDPSDRPYAGWLYAGFGLMQDNDSRSLDHIELLAGVVGPSALAHPIQNNFHALVVHQPTALGWHYQIKDEPAGMLTLERIWRVHPFTAQWLEILPEAGATLGNVMTYAHTGVTLRIGKGLKADYGQPHIRPGASGTDYFNPYKIDDSWGAYLFVSAQGRAVAHNIFLDGNTWRDSRSVEANPFVADFTAGASLFWTNGLKIDYMAGVRTQEFEHQKRLDRLGGVNLAYQF